MTAAGFALSPVRTGEIALPRCELGIGTVIRSPESADLIEGVQLTPVILWPDDRGYFLEVFRCGHASAAGFAVATTQVSSAVSYPGTIKAFHYHREQTDLWTPVAGMLQVALVDLRPESPTFGQRNTIYTGHLKPLQVLIPPGVGHGYRVIGESPAVLVYATDRFYNPSDEGRIPHNEPGIHYDWAAQWM